MSFMAADRFSGCVCNKLTYAAQDNLYTDSVTRSAYAVILQFD